jgi:hypothetical protein
MRSLEHRATWIAAPGRPRRLTRVLVAAACLVASTAAAQPGGSIRFHGNGSGDIDRVKIAVDDPATSTPGPPVDVGAEDFTIEFWIRALPGDNRAGPIACGTNYDWITGNIIVDRDRFNQTRAWGLSLGGGRLAWGVMGPTGASRTICGSRRVDDGAWHHVAVARRRSDGWLWIFVDGALDAQGDGPDGDVSYPDDGVPGNYCGGPCTWSDPFLVLGAEKHDAGPAYPSFSGWIDELRLSRVLRYSSAFPPPSAPFAPDAFTVGLYHFDEQAGTTAHDTSGAPGGPSHGLLRVGGTPQGPEWSADTPFAAGPFTDLDRDGLPDEWERRFGLDAASGAGPDGRDGDPDSDGRTNLDEYQDGTHPRGFVTRHLAEGVTSSFFRTRLALVNPGEEPAIVLLRFLRAGAPPSGHVVTVPAQRRATVDVGALAGMEGAEFATLVESDRLIVVDRTVTWGGGYGSHTETAAAAPATRWYLAEGSTRGAFDLFYLLQNASLTEPATVRITYLRPSLPPIVSWMTVGASRRETIWVDRQAGLEDTDVSAVVEVVEGPPILVERAMYLSNASRTFNAGHASLGVTTAATTWYFAEGATGPYFDEFVLIANPAPVPVSVRATYLLPSGATLSKDYVVGGERRFTVWLDHEEFPGLGRALADTAVSVLLTSLNGVPFVAERAMWWPGTVEGWTAAHGAAGATAAAPRWAVADGEVGGADDADTFILIANTSSTGGRVRVRLLFEDGPPVERTFTVPAASRFNVWVRVEFPDAYHRRFGAVVESVDASPLALVVERATYFSPNGEPWAAGTGCVATRLP